MKLRKYELLKDAANDIKVLKELSYMHMRIEGRLLPEGKAELRSFTSNGSKEIRNCGSLAQFAQNDTIILKW